MLPDELEDIASGGIEEGKVNGFERGTGFQVLDHLSEHDARALVHGETGNAGANGGKRNGFEFSFGSETKGMCGGGAERFGSGGGAAKAHAGGVNDVARLEFAAACDGRITDGDASEFVAFALDFVAALAANGAGHTAAENEIVVGSVDDGVDVHFGEVALLDDDAFGERCHWKDIVEQVGRAAGIRYQGSEGRAKRRGLRTTVGEEPFGSQSGG